MGQLYQNIYDNPSRIVTGVVTIFPDDVQILCDSSGGAVTINLLSIPAFKWNVNYKLYIADYTNNASTNNITINAGAGQTINGASSIVINSNGGACLVQVGSNTTYIATFYPLPVGTSLSIADILGPVTTSTTKITFTNAVVNATSATEVDVTTLGGVSAITALAPLTGGTITTSGNIGINAANGTTDGYLAQADWTTFNNKVGSVGVTAPVTNSGTSTAPVIAMAAASGSTDGYLTQANWNTFNNKVSSVGSTSPITIGGTSTAPSVGFYDSGWVNCDGFEHMAGSSARPQFRIYGKQVFLRGTAVVPLANAGTFISLTTTGANAWYVNDLQSSPFTGTTGLIKGVTFLGGGSIIFNLGQNIIPSSFNPSSLNYTETYSQFVVGWRPIITSASNTYNFLTGAYVIRFGKGSLSTLRIDSIREYETGAADTMPTFYTPLAGTSNLRRIVGSVTGGQFVPDYQSMVTGGNNSSSPVNTSFVQNNTIFFEPISATNPTFPISIDSSRASDMGAFQFTLDGITSFLG